RLGARSFDRHSHFFNGLGFSRGILRLRATRDPSALLDATDVAPAVFARARNRSFAQQCSRGSGSDLQSQIRFHAHSEVRDRTQIAVVAKLQVSRVKIDLADRRTGSRDLFQLLRLVRIGQRTVLVGTV